MILESQCVASDVSDSVFQYRSVQYLGDIMNKPQTTSYMFCDYHTSSDGGSNGGAPQINSGRRRRASSLGAQRYNLQIKNTTLLAGGKVLFAVTALDTQQSFSPVGARSMCSMLGSAQDVHCVGSADCTSLQKFGFRCGVSRQPPVDSRK